MAVGITVGSITDEIGTPSFVHAFFSTISAHGEIKGWGSRFPRLLNELYQGRLSHLKALEAVQELRQAKDVLEKLPPTAVVWDIENTDQLPPWGDNIASNITSLGDYFVSSTGRDLFALLDEALVAAAHEKQDATLG